MWISFFGIVSALKLQMLAHWSWLRSAPEVDLWKVFTASTFDQIDEAVICRKHGYADLDAYREASDPTAKLHDVSVPLLVVHSQDDPILSSKNWGETCMNKIRDNPLVDLIVTRHGGHIGWGSQHPVLPIIGNGWADHVCLRYLNSVVDRLDGECGVGGGGLLGQGVVVGPSRL
jgi:predicted alpha/beta-fold hydrolase